MIEIASAIAACLGANMFGQKAENVRKAGERVNGVSTKVGISI